MRAPNLGETELLIPLHNGMFDQPMWHVFLERLRVHASCDAAVLFISPPDSSVAMQFSSGGTANMARLDQLLGRDPSVTREREEMRVGRVYSLDDLVEMGGPPARQLRDEKLVPIGLSHALAIRIRVESVLDAWLLLFAKHPIASAASALLGALAPHLEVAVGILGTLERERARATLSAGAFRHINFGWISVDASCRIVDFDEQALEFMRRSGVLYRGRYDRLSVEAHSDDRQLSAIVKEFARNPDARPRALNLSQDPWIDVLISPVRVGVLSGRSEAVAVVYFRGDQSSRADRCQQLVDVFNLTQSEARFAWSIGQGLSIAEAAECHSLTIETARNYSKKIYAKTGSKGQVDFMRRVLTSVVTLTVH